MIRKLTVTLLLLATSMSFGQTEAEFKTACAKLCTATINAFKTKNAAWFEANSSPDFTYVDAKGKKQTKKQSIDGMKQMFAMAKTIDVKAKCGATTFKNGLGTHANTMVTTIKMVGPDKKPHTMVVTVTSVDSFKKVGGKWLFTQVKETAVPKYLMDGKPFNPGG